MKKLLLLLLCVPLLFSCGKKQKENTTSAKTCSITENIWINETNQIRNFYRDYLPASLESEFYFALRFLKNGNIEVYKCGKSFINKTSDIINEVDDIGVWGLNQWIISDTCCYLMRQPYYVFPLPNQFKDSINKLPKWKKIDDNTVVIVYPDLESQEWPQNIGGNPNSTQFSTPRSDTLNLIDCNTLESSNGIGLLTATIPGMILEISPYYNRSPKVNIPWYNF